MKQLKMFMAVTLFALIAVACGGAKTPEAVATEFMEVLAKGDGQKVFDLLYITEEDNDPSVEEMMKGKLGMIVETVKAETDAKGGLKNVEVESVEYNDDKTAADVTLIITFKREGMTETETLRTISTKDGWKVKL